MLAAAVAAARALFVATTVVLTICVAVCHGYVSDNPLEPERISFCDLSKLWDCQDDCYAVCNTCGAVCAKDGGIKM